MPSEYVSYDIAEGVTVYGVLFTGNTTSTGQSLSEYEAGVTYKTPRGSFYLLVRFP